MKVDLIIIDGFARNACLSVAKDYLNRGGFVILHDANRNRYFEKQMSEQFKYSFLITDYRRSAGGIWIGSNDQPIETVLDTQKHSQKWQRINNKFSKILSL